MKTAGIILLLFAFICLVIGILAPEEYSSMQIRGAMMWGFIGAFLIYKANKKKRSENEKDKWENK